MADEFPDMDWSEFTISDEELITPNESVNDNAKTESSTTEAPKQKPPSATIPPKIRVNDRKVIKDALIGLYSTMGLGLGAVDMTCGTAIVESAEQCADAWLELADSNEAVRNVLMKLTQANAWTGIVIAHVPILLAISSHHIPMVRNMTMRMEPEPETNGPQEYDVGATMPLW